jgi:hypothetical protein
MAMIRYCQEAILPRLRRKTVHDFPARTTKTGMMGIELWCLPWIVLFSLLVGKYSLSADSKVKGVDATPSFTGSDRGTFKIFSDGQLVGKETFQISGDSMNFKAAGETLLVLERMKEKVTFNIKASYQFSRSFEPLSYQVTQEAGGNVVKASVKFKAGGCEVLYDTGKDAADRRTIELERDVLVLDDNVYHHYIVLARRYNYLKGGDQQFSAFIPQQYLSGDVTVSDKGNEAVDFSGVKVMLQHLLVDTGDLQISLWLDPNHVLKKIAVPQSKVEVIRE